MAAGYIYLLAETYDGTQHTGLYKIGKTTQPNTEKRKRQYQAGNARPLIVVREVWVEDCQYTETALQRFWKAQGNHYYLGGGDEWFKFSEDELKLAINLIEQANLHKNESSVFQEISNLECSYPNLEHLYENLEDFESPIETGCGCFLACVLLFMFLGAIAGNHRSTRQPVEIDIQQNHENTIIGNRYFVRCSDDSFTHVNLRAAPSLNAPIKDELECNKATVFLTGELVLTDDYWYPVETSDGKTGFIARVGIDP